MTRRATRHLCSVDKVRLRRWRRLPPLQRMAFRGSRPGPGRDAHLSFTVPGAVDAYLKLLETFGTRTIVEVLAPALEYAEQGFPMYEYMHHMLSIRETRSQFALYPPGGEAVFYPAGRVPRV